MVRAFKCIKIFFLISQVIITQLNFANEKYMINGNLAIVNGEPLMYSEIQDSINILKYSENNVNVNEVDIFGEILKQKLIKTTYKDLLDKEHIKMQISAQMKFIENEVGNHARMMLSKYFNNDEKRFIQEIGSNVEDYIENSIKIQKKQLMSMLIIQEINNLENLSPKKILEFYNENKDKNIFQMLEERYEIYELVMYKKISDESKKKINLAYDEICRNKNNFEEIAKKYSEENINLGRINVLNDNSNLAYYASRLKIGEISEIIEDDSKYYILKLIDKSGDDYILKAVTISNNEFEKDISKAFDFLENIKKDIVDRKITWEEAVKKYSQNEANNKFNGKILGVNCEDIISKDDLSQKEFDVIKLMKVGEISEPFCLEINGKTEYKLLFLKQKYDKSKASYSNNFDIIRNIYRNEEYKKYIDMIFYKLLQKEDVFIDFRYKICRDWYEKLKSEIKKHFA